MDFDIFTTDGRIRRIHYLAYMFIISIAASIVQILVGLVLNPIPASIVSLIITLPVFWVSYCVAVQRSNDMGQGKPFVVWMYIAMLSGFVVLITGAITAAMQIAVSMPIIGLGATLMFASFAMSMILLFAGPDKHDRYGPDPR